MSILRSLPGLRDSGLIGSKGDRETIWEKPLCVSPSSFPPIFSILVPSKVFALVLMARDDLEIIVMKACCMKGASVYLREIQSKPKISLGRKRMWGNQELDVVHESWICVFVILCLRISTPSRRCGGRYQRNTATIYSQKLMANVHHVNFSYRSISSGGFSKDVYVLVWPLCHHPLCFFPLSIYLSELKHNLKKTQISHPLISFTW